MNVLDYLIESVKYRAFQIKSEIELLQNQLSFASNYNSKDYVNELQFKLSLRIDLHSLYATYLNGFIDTYEKIGPYKKAMQLHFYSLKISQSFFQLSLDQIDEKQKSYREKNHILPLSGCDQTIEELLKTMDLFFPYKNFFILLNESPNIFPEMIKICLCYDPTSPTKTLKSLFALLKKENCNAKLHCGDLVVEMIAHIILSIFTHRLTIQDANDPLSNYKFRQNSFTLVEEKFKPIEIDHSLINLIEKNIGYKTEPVTQEIQQIVLTEISNKPQNTNKGVMTPDLRLIKAHSNAILPGHIASSASGERNSLLFYPMSFAEQTEIHQYTKSSYKFYSNPLSHKYYDRTIDFPKLYDNDPNSPFQCLHNITLEMRKLIIQPCVALSYNILNNVTMMINSVLFDKDRSVGSDESFPFFIAVLADARFFLLPSLLKRLNDLMPCDFLSSRFIFLQKKLQIAHDFILSMVVKAPPYILLPFDSIEPISGIKRVQKTDKVKSIPKPESKTDNSKQKPNNESTEPESKANIQCATKDITKNDTTNNKSNEIGINSTPNNNTDSKVESNTDNTTTESKNVDDNSQQKNDDAIFELANDDKIVLDSFLIYVYPNYMNTAFPSIVHYTGDNRNLSTLYKYEIDDSKDAPTTSFFKIKSWTAIPTKYGTIMQCPAKENEIKSLIHIGNNAEYTSILDTVNDISNMMFMCQFPLSMKPINVSKYDELKQEFHKYWNVKSVTFDIVKQIQTILKKKKFLPQNHDTDGIIDVDTANSIKRAVNAKDSIYLTPRIYAFLTS